MIKMKKKIKMCHGGYKVIKEVERHMISGREPNNHRRLHGKPLRRRQKFRFLMLKMKKESKRRKENL